MKEEEDLNDKLTNKSQECRAQRLSKKLAHKSKKKYRAPRPSKKMAQKSEKKCKKKCKKKCRALRLSKNKNEKKCLLTRAEWLYILVEGRGNLGPKQWGNLRPKQCFRL